MSAPGHNGGPPIVDLNGEAFRGWVRLILSRGDLSATQKLVAICIAVDANSAWETELRTDDIKRLATIKDRETVSDALRKLQQHGVIAKERRIGYASSYRILPPYVVSSVVDAYETLKSERQAMCGKNPQMEISTPGKNPAHDAPTPGIKPADDVWEKPADADADMRVFSGEGEKPTGLNPHIEQPDMRVFSDVQEIPADQARVFPADASSRAYRNNNLLLELEEIPASEVREEIPPKAPRKPKAGPGRLEALEAFNAWNATAERCNLAKANRMTPDRERIIIARLKEHGLDGWHRAMGIIEQSAFLCGENDRGWRMDFDTFVKPIKMNRVLEGAYGNGRHKAVVETEFEKATRFVEEFQAAKKPKHGGLIP